MDKLRSLKSLSDELMDMYPDNPIVKAFVDKYRNWGFENKEHMMQEMAIALAKDWERTQNNIELLMSNTPKPIIQVRKGNIQYDSQKELGDEI